MARFLRFAVLLALSLLAADRPAAAQVVLEGSALPCTARFSPIAYPEITRFVPSDIPKPILGNVRGVVARSLLWRPGETLKVCFRSGTNKARARVAGWASEWMQHGNVRLDFGPAEAPHTCKGDNSEDIKVDFLDNGPRSGFWSAIGTTSRKVDHSMNLSYIGRDELPRDNRGRQMPQAEARRLVLHEFGHALGLFHEHQSPRAACEQEYYEEAVLAFGALRGWPAQQTINNFKQLVETSEINASDIDRKSIMHYSLPPWLFKSGPNSACWVPPNEVLSEGDKTFIAKVYPKEQAPGPVASGPRPGQPGGPVAGGTRGGRPGGGAAGDAGAAGGTGGDALVAEYRALLEQAGLAKSRIDRLTADFRSSLAGR